jgi:SAM-dependent methyltransferase
VATSESERFWDARARERALFYVDNRLDYRHPDEERFWAGGEEALAELLGTAGAELAPDEVVVDIGCGVGRLTRAVAGRVAHVYAVDVSSEMLDRARELNPGLANVTWVHGDGRGLGGVPDAAAGAVVSHVVFQHIPDPAVILGYVREMGRVLRPDGWGAFQVSTDPAVHRPPAGPRRLRWRLAAALGRGPSQQEHAAWLGSAVSAAALREAADDGGLVIDRMTGEGTQFTTVLARRT